MNIDTNEIGINLDELKTSQITNKLNIINKPHNKQDIIDINHEYDKLDYKKLKTYITNKNINKNIYESFKRLNAEIDININEVNFRYKAFPIIINNYNNDVIKLENKNIRLLELYKDNQNKIENINNKIENVKKTGNIDYLYDLDFLYSKKQYIKIFSIILVLVIIIILIYLTIIKYNYIYIIILSLLILLLIIIIFFI